jgi:hypothetical protein
MTFAQSARSTSEPAARGPVAADTPHTAHTAQEDFSALVATVCGLPNVAGAELLSPPGAKKNVVVGYRHAGDDLVLKVYRQALRYTIQALKNPLSRWISRAFTLRSLARTRVRAELDGIAGFRLAGLRTFDVVAWPRSNALVFRREAGEPLRDLLRERADPRVSRRYVERLGADLRRRQAIACQRNDLRMVHPAPRLQHAWLRPDDTLLYYDFEDRVNPVLRVVEAAAMETESVFFDLLRLPETADPATVEVARQAVGTEVIDRWEEESTRRRLGLSGSARRRCQVLDTVLRGRRTVPTGA